MDFLSLKGNSSPFFVSGFSFNNKQRQKGENQNKENFDVLKSALAFNRKTNIFSDVKDDYDVLFGKKNADLITFSRKINDYDSDLFEKDISSQKTTPSIKIELQIQKAENKLLDLSEQARMFQALEITDEFVASEKLKEQENDIRTQLKDYRKDYKNLGFSYAITAAIEDVFDSCKQFFSRLNSVFVANNAFESVLEVIPAVKERNELKKIVEKYEAIRKNADDIVSNPNPFGELEFTMDRLTFFMGKSNQLDIFAQKFSKVEQKQANPVTSFLKEKYSSFIEFVASHRA